MNNRNRIFTLPENILKTFFTILTAVLSITTATSQVDFGDYYTKVIAEQILEA